MLMYSIMITGCILGTTAYFVVRVARYRRNLDDVLRPIVEAEGLELIDSRSPTWFRTGPFPLVTGKIGTLQTEFFGVRGEYWTYRIVRVRSAAGVKEVWVRLYFEALRPREIEWRPALAELKEHALP
jgi:hypothetical protein